MGAYEWEQAQIAAGTAGRGAAALRYFEELDENLAKMGGDAGDASALTHRPNYAKTLFAEENDDIYQEFCRFLDQPVRRFDTLPDQMRIEGYCAYDVYCAMIKPNPRLVDIDGAAVYNMLVKLRKQPEIAKRVLGFRPTCYQGGCGFEDGAYDKGLQPWQQQDQCC